MYSDRDSAYAIAYLDEDFAYQNGRFCVDNLVLIGWLLCFHWSKEIQIDELWDIVNPKFAEEVDRDVVIKIFEDIIYIATYLNQKIVSSLPKTAEKQEAL